MHFWPHELAVVHTKGHIHAREELLLEMKLAKEGGEVEVELADYGRAPLEFFARDAHTLATTTDRPIADDSELKIVAVQLTQPMSKRRATDASADDCDSQLAP